jgi:hypothetical protein
VRATTAVSLLVLAGSLAAARGVGNLYPVSQFPMYSGSAGEASARLVVLVDGEYRELDAFDRFACRSWLLAGGRCEGASSIPYLDRDAESWVRGHLGVADGGVPIDIVRRVFSFDGVQRPPHCVVTSCVAVPR